MLTNFNSAEDTKSNFYPGGNFLRQKDPLQLQETLKIPEVHGISKKIFRRKEYSGIRSRDPKIIFNELEQEDGVPIRKVNIGRKTNLPSIKLSNIETVTDEGINLTIKPRWKTPIN